MFVNFLKSPVFAEVFGVWVRDVHEMIVAFVEIGLGQSYTNRQDGMRVHPFALAAVKMDAANFALLMKCGCAEWYGHSEASEYKMAQ